VLWRAAARTEIRIISDISMAVLTIHDPVPPAERMVILRTQANTSLREKKFPQPVDCQNETTRACLQADDLRPQLWLPLC
jgi:hypothetical protein